MWADVKPNASTEVIADVPTLLTTHTNPITKVKFANVLKAGFKSMSKQAWLKGLQKYAANHNLSHIHIEPMVDISSKLLQESPIKPINAQHTVINDISLSEDELLAKCSKTHRQNIRKGIAKGLKTEVYTEGNVGLQRFLEVMRNISTTKSFLQFEEQHYTKVWTELSAAHAAFIVIGSYHDEDIGAYLVAHSHAQASQFYGGRTEKGRNERLAHSLAFKVMLAAKDQGCHSYDMWGIGAFDKDGKLDPNHELYGIGQFKTGFGGLKIKHPSAVVLVNRPFTYKAFIAAKSAQKLVIKAKKQLKR